MSDIVVVSTHLAAPTADICKASVRAQRGCGDVRHEYEIEEIGHVVAHDARAAAGERKGLIDALAVMDADGLDFETGGGLKAAVLREAENDSSLHIVMPLKN